MEKVSVSLPALSALAALFVLEQTEILILAVLAAAIHECGHLIGIRLCHRELLQFKLMLSGAEIVYSEGSYQDDFRIALLGPVASLLLALAAAAGGRLLDQPFLYMLAGISLLFGLFNLLPALPLDGGRILFACLSRKAGPGTATRVLRATGAITAGLIGILGIYSFWSIRSNISLICAGLFLIFFVVKGAKMV